MQVRPTTVKPRIYTKTTAGSALVRVGNTQVAGSVTWQIGQGTAGDVVVQIESVTSTSYNQEPALTIWQSRIQRLLLDTLDWTSLTFQPGWAWRACVGLAILQDDGSVTDALLTAAVAALSTATLPTDLKLQPNGQWAIPSATATTKASKPTRPFADAHLPLSLTLGLWYHNDNKPQWMVDPTAAEEAALVDGLLQLIVLEGTLWSVEFTGEFDALAAHLPLLETLAVERAKEVQDILSALGDD